VVKCEGSLHKGKEKNTIYGVDDAKRGEIKITKQREPTNERQTWEEQ